MRYKGIAFWIKMSEENQRGTEFDHPAWRQETFLTAPADRTMTPQQFREQIVRNTGVPPLNNQQTLAAMNDLCVGNPVPDYPGVERLYADPVMAGQKFALFTFVPAKGATPDSDGFYGMAKIRGVSDSAMELEQREEFLIRNVDSYHKIQRPWVGRPFPITIREGLATETKEIDIRKKTTEVISQDIKKQRMDDQKEIRDIEDRAEKLREDTGKEVGEEDPMELYTTLTVKKAQLTWTYLEHKKKLEEIKGIIIKTRKEIKDMDAENSKYREDVYNKYMKAREESNLPKDDNSFVKYLVEDVILDFDEETSGRDNDGDNGEDNDEEAQTNTESEDKVDEQPSVQEADA